MDIKRRNVLIRVMKLSLQCRDNLRWNTFTKNLNSAIEDDREQLERKF